MDKEMLENAAEAITDPAEGLSALQEYLDSHRAKIHPELLESIPDDASLTDLGRNIADVLYGARLDAVEAGINEYLNELQANRMFEADMIEGRAYALEALEIYRARRDDVGTDPAERGLAAYYATVVNDALSTFGGAIVSKREHDALVDYPAPGVPVGASRVSEVGVRERGRDGFPYVVVCRGADGVPGEKLDQVIAAFLLEADGSLVAADPDAVKELDGELRAEARAR